MLEPVLKTISRYNMLPAGSRVAVAVSGGADSVCLLHVLLELMDRLNVTIAGVAHFNHQLRAEASDEDELFVAAMAERLGLRSYRASAPLGAGNLEQAARRARKAFFTQLIRENVADRVALGHTRDDQSETVLFRLLRGSGPSGLAGIYPVTTDGLIRPLIGVTREQVEEFLHDRRIAWREDATNQTPRFARNRIRHSLLPQLARDWNPQIGDGLAQLADLAQEEELWWNRELERHESLFRESPLGGVETRAEALTGQPRAFARRLIRRAIALAKGDLRRIEYSHIERILELASESGRSGRLKLPGLQVTRSFDTLRFSLPENAHRDPVQPVPLTIPGTYAAPDGATRIRLEVAEDANPGCVNLRAWGRVPAHVELRGWRSGDRYRPVGQSRVQSVKEMFQCARIPSWRRPYWPILTSEDKILWVRGFGAADEFTAGRGAGPVLCILETETARR